jgi:hypothetical protein
MAAFLLKIVVWFGGIPDSSNNVRKAPAVII